MHPDLPDRLRTLRDLLGRVAADGGAAAGLEVSRRAEEAAERLDRDLLPRTAGGHTHLVVGIVGPNNAGKSALFNALVGAALSPSLPTGGATRRLVGAAHPELTERLQSEPTLAQFPLRVVKPGPQGVEEALSLDADPAVLLLVERDSLPTRVLLVDTPDFDSILAENRQASESLLKVADLAVVVVTRHTYQNREVVEFLESWLAHGRPWMLVYNESLGAEVTREHAAKLAEDLASPPVAVFHAAFDLAIAEGQRPLLATALATGTETEAASEARLGEWLFDLPRAEELKARALSASVQQLRDELRGLEQALRSESDRSGALLERARRRAAALGRDVASLAMPMAPFLDAFRAVLDRRPGLLQRGYRDVLRRARLFVEGALSRVPFLRRHVSAPERSVDLLEVEREALEPLWPAWFEDLAAGLDPSRNATVELDPELARRLVEDLAPKAGGAARERALAAMAEDPDVLRAFQEACEELIEEELAERGTEWFFQLAVDAVHFLPAVAAGVVIVHTGGLGADVAVGGAGALSSLLAEKISRLLGTQVARRARERWRRLRGERLAKVFLESALAESAALLERRAVEPIALAGEVRESRKVIAWDQEQ